MKMEGQINFPNEPLPMQNEDHDADLHIDPD